MDKNLDDFEILQVSKYNGKRRAKASNNAINKALYSAMSKLMSELERTRMQIILNYLDANKDINSSIVANYWKPRERRQADLRKCYSLQCSFEYKKSVPQDKSIRFYVQTSDNKSSSEV